LPFYYSSNNAQAVSASANTDTDLFRFLTVSPRPCNITRLICGNTGAAAQDSQIYVRFQRMSVASTSGSAFVPLPHDPGAQAAVTTPFTLPSVGTPLASPALNLGFNSRAMVQWVALNPDEALFLATAGGANGNIDLIAQEGAGTAFTLRFTITHWE
jgi:hypothetical protein